MKNKVFFGQSVSQLVSRLRQQNSSNYFLDEDDEWKIFGIHDNGGEEEFNLALII